MNLELDLNKIKKLGEKRRNENFNFRSYLKNQDEEKVDKIVHQLHAEITAKIDCTQCGNCCDKLRPALSETELKSLAEIDNLPSVEFERQFVEQDEFEEIKYLKDIPCKYLKDKKCTIYNQRPDECRSYPHTHKDEFTTRLHGVIDNYEVCPIVFNLYEQLKDVLRFRRSG